MKINCPGCGVEYDLVNDCHLEIPESHRAVIATISCSKCKTAFDVTLTRPRRRDRLLRLRFGDAQAEIRKR